MYISALSCTVLLSNSQVPLIRDNFGGVFPSLYIHFVILTVEGFPELVAAIAEDPPRHFAVCLRRLPDQWWRGHGASWCNRDCGRIDGTCKALFKAEQVMTSKGLWFEIVFDAAQDVEIVSLRMGGTVKPPACSGDSCKDKAPDESPDDEFAHALDDAELLFGQGQMELMGGEVGCRKYFKVRNIAGREVFWKSNNTRYVNAVKCIRISIPCAQQHPLLLRAFEVRSSKAGFNIPPELDTRWSLQGAIHSQRIEIEAWIASIGNQCTPAG